MADAARQVVLSSFELLPTAVHEAILDLMPMQARLRLEHQVSKPLQSRLQHRARHDVALRQAATVWTVDEFQAVLSDDPGNSFATLAPHSRAAVLVALAHRLRGLPSSSHGTCFQALLAQALRLPPPLRAMPMDALAECLGDSALKMSGDTQVACAERIAAEPLTQSARLRRALLRRALLLQGRGDLATIAAHLLPDARAALELVRAYPAPCHVDTHSIVAGALARTGADQDAADVWRDLLEGAAQETLDAGQQGGLIALLARLLPPVPGSHPSGERDDDASGKCMALLLDTVFSLPGERLYHALAWLLGAAHPASTGLYLYAARAKQQLQLLDGIAQRMESAALTEPRRLHLRAAFLRYLPDQAAWDTLWQAAMGGEHGETLTLLGALLPLCQMKAPDTTRLQAVASAGLHVSTLAPSDRSALLKDVLYQRRNHIDDAGLAEATFASVARLARDHGDYGLLAQWPQRNQQTERDRVVGVILDLPPAEQVKAAQVWVQEGNWGELGDLACFSALAEPLAQAGHPIQLAELAGAICNRCAEWIGVTDARAWPGRWADVEEHARHLAGDWIGLLERMPPCRTPAALAAAAQFAHQLDAVTDRDGALVRRAWEMIARLDADDLRACLAQLLPLRPQEAWNGPARVRHDKLPRSAVVSAVPLVRARLSTAERREWLAYCLGRLWVQESERERLQTGAHGRRFDGRFDSARQAIWALATSLPPAQWAYAAPCLAEWFVTPPDAAEERAAWEQAKARFHAVFGH
ncbi:hypothetical protein [Cupriavidus sp. AU9028]|uniref:hypothetical protein n=1 Tax=Cupriavidus sp. AU9028 TaxID=2871157 RepID=UPI001C975959|nr:hypothetical protein [Cupriavidus sp. AU9028]MBY4898871.1 hypothetical protein [Cupriavidus sp. AU9028]